MTGQSYTEQDLGRWLETTGRTPLPTDVDDLLTRTARARQRPAWSFPERWLPMDISVQAPTVAGRRPSLRAIALVALVILGLVAGAVVVAGSRRPLPAQYGLATNGLVAYVVPVGDSVTTPNGYVYLLPHGDIATVDPVTGATTTLVGGPSLDRDPVFSLDGTRLAFVRETEAGQMLYVVDPTGGEPRPLTKEPLPDIRDLAWSPDGASIAFSSPDGDLWHLWIARSDGSGARRVTMDPALSVVLPQWRPPVGDEILVVGSRSAGLAPALGYRDLWGGDRPGATGVGLFVVRPDGSGLRPITAADGGPYDYGHAGWTPDGQRIITQRTDPNAFGYTRIRVLSADGAELQVIGPHAGVDALDPVVAPDGRWVAFADMSADGNWRLRVASIDGSVPPVDLADFGGGAAAYAWSPDGRSIIVTHQYFKETWLVDVVARTKTKVAWVDPGSPAWQRTAD